MNILETIFLKSFGLTTWYTGSLRSQTRNKTHCFYCEIVQSWPTLCDPMDGTVHGILQSRTLEWVAIPFSRGSSQPRDWVQVSCISGRFFTSWATREAQEYWSGEPIPSPGDLPNPGIEPGSPALQVDSLPAELHGKPNVLCLLSLIITSTESSMYVNG